MLVFPSVSVEKKLMLQPPARRLGQQKAACSSGEIMIGAYRTGDNASLRMDGSMGAACQDANAMAVVSCATK